MDGDGQVSAPSVFGPPPLAHDPAFDVRVFLDPWGPRRRLNALQRARMARGLTQDELAAELGVSRHTVSSMENRRRVPSVRLALAVAAALHGTVEELFADEEPR
jgi:putative transcriptional regulator